MEVEVAQPVIDAPAGESQAPPAEESGSLADHEASFGPAAKQTPVDDGDDSEAERNAKGQFVRPPHRAQSHRAGAADVEEIQAQTARLRQAEKDAGITAPEKKPGESDRAYKIRREADLVEAIRDAKKAATVAPQNGNGSRRDAPGAANGAENGYKPVPFAKAVPTPEDFANSDNPLLAYTRAIAAYDREEWLHNITEQEKARRSVTSQHEAVEEGKKWAEKINGNIAEFIKEKPDYWAKMDAVNHIGLPDVAMHALAADDKQPQLAYYLATHKKDLLEVKAFASKLNLDADGFATMREYLQEYYPQALGAASQPTGAPASASPVIVAPRPPTPVRTGPLKTGDEPPGDDSSLADHEKHYAPKRR